MKSRLDCDEHHHFHPGSDYSALLSYYYLDSRTLAENHSIIAAITLLSIREAILKLNLPCALNPISVVLVSVSYFSEVVSAESIRYDRLIGLL